MQRIHRMMLRWCLLMVLMKMLLLLLLRVMMMLLLLLLLERHLLTLPRPWASSCFQFQRFQLAKNFATVQPLLERKHRMIGGHRVHEQQLLLIVLLEQPLQIGPRTPTLERFEQLVRVRMIARPVQRKKQGHLAPDPLVGRFARCNVRDELLRIVHLQLGTTQLRCVPPAQLLQVRAEEPQLERQAHVQHDAHRVYSAVALQISEPTDDVLVTNHFQQHI